MTTANIWVYQQNYLGAPKLISAAMAPARDPTLISGQVDCEERCTSDPVVCEVLHRFPPLTGTRSIASCAFAICTIRNS